ncbi:MAG TPA: hypothetical protein VLT16_00780 [Candidatus Limnocylindrales bacterium]|nr:hypothetical protein [Candidatus Limnocylindrales bacterium]
MTSSPAGSGQAAAAAPARSVPSFSSTESPRGVRGWLLLFCLGVTVFGPAAFLVQMGNASHSLNSGYLLDFLRVMSGAVAGALLWTQNPVALKAVRVYFILLGVTVVVVLLSLVASGMRVGTSVLMGPNFSNFTRLGINGCIWLAYFMKSERVRNTYGANL